MAGTRLHYKCGSQGDCAACEAARGLHCGEGSRGGCAAAVAADDAALQLWSCGYRRGCAAAVTATEAALQRWQRFSLCCMATKAGGWSRSDSGIWLRGCATRCRQQRPTRGTRFSRTVGWCWIGGQSTRLHYKLAASETAMHARQPGGCTAVKAAEGAALQLWQPRGLRCSCGNQGGCTAAVTAIEAVLQPTRLHCSEGSRGG